MKTSHTKQGTSSSTKRYPQNEQLQGGQEIRSIIEPGFGKSGSAPQNWQLPAK